MSAAAQRRREEGLNLGALVRERGEREKEVE